MGLTRPLGQLKVSLIFALLNFFFFFLILTTTTTKKKAPREVMQASAKGERRSDFDWPWRYSETILIWTKKELKEPKPKTCFVLTQLAESSSHLYSLHHSFTQFFPFMFLLSTWGHLARDSIAMITTV
jgi:hypothetical protein